MHLLWFFALLPHYSSTLSGSILSPSFALLSCVCFLVWHHCCCFLFQMILRADGTWPHVACSTSTIIAPRTLNKTWKQWINETEMLEVDYKYLLSKTSMRAPPSTIGPQLHVFFITTSEDFHDNNEPTKGKHNNLEVVLLSAQSTQGCQDLENEFLMPPTSLDVPNVIVTSNMQQ